MILVFNITMLLTCMITPPPQKFVEPKNLPYYREPKPNLVLPSRHGF